MNPAYSFIMIAVSAVCLFLSRALPFLLFRNSKQIPPVIHYLGNVLPSAIMACLVVYCLKAIPSETLQANSASLLAVAMVVCVHLWKRNTLLSVGIGTVVYMLLTRLLG